MKSEQDRAPEPMPEPSAEFTAIRVIVMYWLDSLPRKQRLEAIAEITGRMNSLSDLSNVTVIRPHKQWPAVRAARTGARLWWNAFFGRRE